MPRRAPLAVAAAHVHDGPRAGEVDGARDGGGHGAGEIGHRSMEDGGVLGVGCQGVEGVRFTSSVGLPAGAHALHEAAPRVPDGPSTHEAGPGSPRGGPARLEAAPQLRQGVAVLRPAQQTERRQRAHQSFGGVGMIPRRSAVAWLESHPPDSTSARPSSAAAWTACGTQRPTIIWERWTAGGGLARNARRLRRSFAMSVLRALPQRGAPRS